MCSPSCNLVVTNSLRRIESISSLTNNWRKGSNVDYFLVKRSNQKCVMECKVILGETVRTQHGLLVMDYKMIEPKVIPMKCEIRITV